MKNIPNNRFYRRFLYILPLFTLIGSVYGMKRLHEEPSQSSYSMEVEKPTHNIENVENIWIRTSDNEIIAMTKWQVDQIKVLQLLLANQKGTNSKNNPINLLDLRKNNGAIVNTSTNILNLIKTCLKVLNEPRVLSIFLLFTKQNNDYDSLINTTFDLEANTLSAALASAILPSDMHLKINTHLLCPIIDYFVRSLATEYTSPQSPQNAMPLPIAPFIKISPNGECLLANNRYNRHSSWLWNFKIEQITECPVSIDNINFSSTGAYFMIHTNNRNYGVYSISKEIIFNIYNSNCIMFSPQDEYCLFNNINAPGTINLKSHKDIPNWIDLPALQGHAAQVNTIQFSPDGKYIISGSNDDYPNNLILWDGNSFEKITNLSYEGPWTAHIYPVIQAHFTPDSKYIISTDNQEYTVIWDVATKKPITKLDIKNKVLWHVDNQKPTTLTITVPHFMYIPQNLHIYINPANPTKKVLYESVINIIFNHSILPINEKAISALITEPQYKRIICQQYSSIPPFAFRKNVMALPNNGYNLQYAVESSDSQYLLLAYQPEYITFTSTNTKKLLHIPVQPYTNIQFSPKNDYIIITHPPTVPNNCMFTIWNIADLMMMRDVVYNPVTITQSHFLYRLYLAMMNNINVIIDKNNPDYEVYKSLSTNLRNLVDRFLPFETTQNA